MNGGSDEVKSSDERHRLQVATEVAAWLCMGAFFGTLAWIAFGNSLYVPFLGKFFGQLPLQLLIAWVVAVPNAFGALWLARRHRQQIMRWFEVLRPASASPPAQVATKEIQGDSYEASFSRKRRTSLAAIDIAAWAVLVVFTACLVWLGSGWKLTFVSFLGKMPIQLLVFIVAMAPTVFSIVWLAVRNAGWISRL
jgi:hypothetical protein